MKTRKFYSAILVALLMLPFEYAISQEYQVQSDYQGTQAALLTPWPVFEQSVQSFAQSSRTFEQQTENVFWKLGQFEFQLTNLHTQVSTAFDVANANVDRFNLASKNMEIQVQVARVAIDQIIEQVVDGAIVRVHIQAECGPLTISNTVARATGILLYQFGPDRISTQLNQFDLQWPTQSWTVSNVICKGPAGFSETLQTELMSRLKSSDEIKPWISHIVADKIQVGVDQLIQRIKVPTAVPLPQQTRPITMTFSGFEARSEGLVTRANLVWNANSTIRTRPFVVPQWPTGVPTHQPTLLLPQEGLSDYMTASVLAAPEIKKIDLQKVESFHNLMHSRIQQLFAWPDLFHYAKASPFSLQLKRPSSFSLKWNANGTARAHLDVQAWVLSFREGKTWNYLNLRSNATGVLSPTVTDGKFQLRAQLDEANVKPAYSVSYTEAFEPKTFLSTRILSDLVKNLRGVYSYSAALPDLTLEPLGLARAQSWINIGNGSIAIPFKFLETSDVPPIAPLAH